MVEERLLLRITAVAEAQTLESVPMQLATECWWRVVGEEHMWDAVLREDTVGIQVVVTGAQAAVVLIPEGVAARRLLAVHLATAIIASPLMQVHLTKVAMAVGTQEQVVAAATTEVLTYITILPSYVFVFSHDLC